jgi:hypothetical protein
VVALICRDMFIKVMALKAQIFANAPEMNRAMKGVMTSHDALIAAVHTPYDGATRHGRATGHRALCDGFFQAAFTRPRSPAVNAPHVTPYKVRLAAFSVRAE